MNLTTACLEYCLSKEGTAKHENIVVGEKGNYKNAICDVKSFVCDFINADNGAVSQKQNGHKWQKRNGGI